MGTLTTFDAENGSDGTTVTQANLPATQAPTIAGGSIFRFEADYAAHGTLGYYLSVATASQCTARLDIVDHLTQRFRGIFKLIATPGGLRTVIHFRHASGNALRVNTDTSNRVTVTNTSGADEVVGPTLTVGTWYDISVLMTVATTSTGSFTLKVYQKDTSTQVGSTITRSNYNMGTTAIVTVDLGTNDTGAGALQYAWDTLRFEDNVGTEFGPYSSGTAYTASPADAAGAADAVALDLATAAADTAAGSDAVARLLEWPAADSAGGSDAAGVGLERSLADAAAGADSAAGAVTVANGAADPASVVDTGAPQELAITLYVSEQVTVYESAGADPGREPVDAAAGSDAATGLQDLARPMADAAGAADVANFLADLSRSMSDAGGATDLAAVTREEFADLDDTAGAADAASYIIALSRADGDVAEILDVADVTRTAALSFADTAGGVDVAQGDIAWPGWPRIIEVEVGYLVA